MSTPEYKVFRVLEVIRECGDDFVIYFDSKHLEFPDADVILLFNTGPYDEGGAYSDVMWKDRTYRGYTDGYSTITVRGCYMGKRPHS